MCVHIDYIIVYIIHKYEVKTASQCGMFNIFFSLKIRLKQCFLQEIFVGRLLKMSVALHYLYIDHIF